MVGVARGGSEAAVRAGAAEAHRAGRPLDLVHVAPVDERWLAQLGRDSLRVATEWAHNLGGEALEVRPRMHRGDLLSALVEAAAPAALLVAERGRAADRRRDQVSTTTTLADTCDVPVLVVPAEWLGERRRVVTVGVDPASADDRPLLVAITRARLAGAVLRVVVAVGERDAASARAEVSRRLQALGGGGCDVALELETAPSDDALLRAADGSDLLVLGRGAPAPTGAGRLRPHQRRVLRESTCPVLLTAPFVPAAATGTS